MAWFVRCSAVLIASLALVGPGMAQPTRRYACTNAMGGNPFTLDITADRYAVATAPDAYKPLNGEGRLDLDASIVAMIVVSGPLHEQWQVDNLVPMSGGTLYVTGSQGIMMCEKRKS